MTPVRFLMILWLLASPWSLVSSALSQTNKPDSQTQQQILDELRAIHRDIRAGTTLQLLLAELQLTQTSVDRALERRDTLKGRITQLQADQKTAEEDVVRTQAARDNASDSNLKEQLTGRLEELKDALRRFAALEQAASEQLQEAEGRLRTAQAERDNVQAQLGDLVKKLSSDN